MADSECECQSIAKQTSPDRRIPTLDNDLRVRRFQRGDTRRIHNLFLEETRCLIWPMFAQTVRSPPVIFFHLFFMVVGVTLARSCIFALFGVILVVCAVFLYIYRWFYQYLTSSLRGDLANISQVSVSFCNNKPFWLAPLFQRPIKDFPWYYWWAALLLHSKPNQNNWKPTKCNLEANTRQLEAFLRHSKGFQNTVSRPRLRETSTMQISGSPFKLSMTQLIFPCSLANLLRITLKSGITAFLQRTWLDWHGWNMR